MSNHPDKPEQSSGQADQEFSLIDWLECSELIEDLDRDELSRFLIEYDSKLSEDFRQMYQRQKLRRLRRGESQTLKQRRKTRDDAVFGNPAQRVMFTVKNWLLHDSVHVRTLAVRLIANTRLGVAGDSVVDTLFDLANDPEPLLRSSSVEALISLFSRYDLSNRKQLAVLINRFLIGKNPDPGGELVLVCQELTDQRAGLPELDRVVSELEQIQAIEKEAHQCRTAEREQEWERFKLAREEEWRQSLLAKMSEADFTTEQLAGLVRSFRRDHVCPSEFWPNLFGSLSPDEVEPFLDRLVPEDQAFLLAEFKGPAQYRFEKNHQVDFPEEIQNAIRAIGQWLDALDRRPNVNWRRFIVDGPKNTLQDPMIRSARQSEINIEAVDFDFEKAYPNLDVTDLTDPAHYWHCQACEQLIPVGCGGIFQCECGNLTVEWRDRKLVTRDDPISVQLVRIVNFG